MLVGSSVGALVSVHRMGRHGSTVDVEIGWTPRCWGIWHCAIGRTECAPSGDCTTVNCAYETQLGPVTIIEREPGRRDTCGPQVIY
jgi:hypothetical protein